MLLEKNSAGTFLNPEFTAMELIEVNKNSLINEMKRLHPELGEITRALHLKAALDRYTAALVDQYETELRIKQIGECYHDQSQ